MQDSEACLALATEAASIGIWEWDIASGRMVYSAQAKAICGFPPDHDVTYDDARRVTHPEDYRRTSAIARRALDPAVPEEVPYEYRIVRPDGAIRWVLAHGRAVFESTSGEVKAVRYVGTLQDITRRRRWEEAERSARARLDLALHAGNLAVWEIDLVTDEVTGSPELNRILGFTEDASPTAAEMRARYYPGEQERLERLGAEALARGERTLEAEYRYLWPDGSVRWLWLRAEGVLDPGGMPIGAVGVITDITDRRQAEVALRASETRLSFLDRLGAETAALSDADRILSTTTRLLGEHLGVSLCAYADMDEDQDGFTIRGDWAAPG